MDNLTNISVVRSLLERHGFTFSKALGQNFIINPAVCPRISQQGGVTPQRGVIEIGAGIGVLTAQLAQDARKVVCIELDSRLLPILDETLAGYDNVTIVNRDVLEVDLHRLIAEEFGGMEVVVCANLPYYITSPILMKLLEDRLPVKAITLMVQKEAAQRICAPPGTRAAGAITAAVHYYSRPRMLFQVSRGSFMPAPNVDSAVISLEVLSAPAVKTPDPALFFKVVKGAFGQRRKTLSNSLSAHLGLGKEQTLLLLEAAQVPPTARAEQLTLEQFAAIATQLYLLGQQ